MFILEFLQSAGIPCKGKPHFWVSADGCYQEEGQKNAKGRIWEKVNFGDDVDCLL